jgi:hypothetical protein
MKKELEGKCFADIAEVQRESLVALNSIPVKDFRKCFQQQKQQWNRHIKSQGEYSEGTKVSDLYEYFK